MFLNSQMLLGHDDHTVALPIACYKTDDAKVYSDIALFCCLYFLWFFLVRYVTSTQNGLLRIESDCRRQTTNVTVINTRASNECLRSTRYVAAGRRHKKLMHVWFSLQILHASFVKPCNLVSRRITTMRNARLIQVTQAISADQM